jgi:protein-S-isoprenylcysteine O-methyltransferase Ste14
MNLHSAVGYVWEALGVIWLIGLPFTKRAKRLQSRTSRLFQLALFASALSLVGFDWFRRGWLGTAFRPPSYSYQVVGLALTIVGCLFAIWARLILGGNWSAQATLKDQHELIEKGPYSLARHPIYTGMLLATAGTTLVFGEWRWVLAQIIIAFALISKMRQEEKLMMAAFPQAYPMYRLRVKAVIPGLL